MAQVTGNGSVIAQEKPERTCRKWQLRVSIGRDCITKKYITKTKRFSGTKTQAEKELRAFINELESGIRTDTRTLTFHEFANAWLEERIMAGEIEEGTIRRLRYHIKTLSSHIGNVRLTELNAETITSLYIKLKNGGSLQGESLSGTTVSHMAVTLKCILEDAVNRDIVLRNPCQKVRRPRRDTKEKAALSEIEARRLIRLLIEGEPTAFKMGTLFALTCGLRCEELVGLRWCDYDKEKRTIRISHAMPCDSRQLKEPKSGAGKRTIPLSAETFKRIEEWRGVQAKYLLSIGAPPTQTTPILTTEAGGFIYSENLSRWWGKFRERNGFEGYSLHQLRHTFATLLVANGVDIVTAKTLMGHSDTKMLTELYAHVVPENVSKATELIGDILYSKEKVTPVIEAGITKIA